uniref:Uncharacterized protein n=1 Tax=Ochrobactrum phage ORM_20 TaxID=2985243 RepID=A0A9N6WS74_9VIRU|nr:hypothetical protein ORM20_00186 [Ochrobactrum phage ORM_20]
MNNSITIEEFLEEVESRDSTILELKAKIKKLETERTMIVSHATMGKTNGVGLSVNEISVCITANRNVIFDEGQKKIEALEAEIKSLEIENKAFRDMVVEIDGYKNLLGRKLTAVRNAAITYCWERYKSRSPMDLKEPAVFTSHEWEKIKDVMDAAEEKVI